MRKFLTVAAGGLAAGPAAAADIAIKVEIPRLTVAEYHRPYVAVWIERPDQSVAATLAVWYDLRLRNNEGTKWLKDLRQWWRRTGRELDMPVDGISGATRPVGAHTLAFAGDHPTLEPLPPGEYRLAVEAAREVGGREMVRIPFRWPPLKAESATAQGKDELGAVTLDIEP
ncbi:MAG: DUF2271 domain-containing protein [Alphaproteobacteria bacterium]|nr:DUF2271 domain-containing protein [Alphaproteobacteria bacterium]